MKNKKNALIKDNLHPRNLHRGRYDFEELISVCPELSHFVKENDYNSLSIDFFDPMAVKVLNKALLKQYYAIDYWDIPDGYLCPPIPGRSDYIHYVNDLLGNKKKVKCLDVGVGANCVYPIIGVSTYNWEFVGTDVDKVALDAGRKNIASNSNLKGNVELRLQEKRNHIFDGVIKENEKFDISICNPPFHSSYKAAQEGSRRKVQNLKRKSVKDIKLNFGGKSNELWCKGGELQFIENMVFESEKYASNFQWFTTLVSKSAHLKSIYGFLDEVGASQVKTIEMGQGNKISRIVAWSFWKT